MGRDLRPAWTVNHADYRMPRPPHPRDARMPYPLASYVYQRGWVATRIRVNRPYATPLGGLAKYSHLPRHGWIAWHHGRPVLMKVRYMCGGYSSNVALERDPSKKLCPKCLYVISDKEQA